MRLGITFRLSRHEATNRDTIEVYKNGRPVAVIYPINDGFHGLKIVSTHLDKVKRDEGPGGVLPSVEISFT